MALPHKPAKKFKSLPNPIRMQMRRPEAAFEAHAPAFAPSHAPMSMHAAAHAHSASHPGMPLPSVSFKVRSWNLHLCRSCCRSHLVSSAAPSCRSCW
jgi:hypothetical protein